MAVIACLLITAMASTSAVAQGRWQNRSGTEPGRTTSAKIYKRPLLRPAPIQFCLNSLDLYDGRFQQRFTRATMRGLQRFRDEFKLEAEDVEHAWAVHALLWRLCRPKWIAAGGALDRFGFAVASQVTGPAAREAPVIAPPPQPSPADFCLAPDLRLILLRTAGRRIDIPSCKPSCLPRPSQISAADAAAYERRLGFEWCAACEPGGRAAGDSQPPACIDPRRLVRMKPGTAGPAMQADGQAEARSLFRRDVPPAEPHRGIAVIIGVSEYQHGLPAWPRAERDATAMRTLLTERLGFAPGRIADLRNPSRVIIEDVFGRDGSPRGLLAERLKLSPGAPLLIYFSGLGAFSRDGDAAYLLPSDAVPGREHETAFAISWLYRNLSVAGAGPVTIIIEADFASDPGAPVVTPNAPETTARVLPGAGMRRLTIMTASERDQRPLGDGESGLSLFTRHFIAGLSGHADAAPNGNADGVIDTGEAFVYAAQHTRLDANRQWGVLQRPVLSPGPPRPLVRVGR